MAQPYPRLGGVQTFPLDHAERQALIRAPFFIHVIPPQKRWGGVQLMNDVDWARQNTPLCVDYVSYNDRLEDFVDSIGEY